jgi:glucose-6-phosphate 1-dehydrogenase
MPEDIVRGQYLAGKGGAGPGYVDHSENREQSRTESYIALKAEISNWRWQGTPFYLRTGKRCARAPARSSSPSSSRRIRSLTMPGLARERAGDPLQPDEGMKLMVMIKEPGPGGMRLMQVPLDMSFADALAPRCRGCPTPMSG